MQKRRIAALIMLIVLSASSFSSMTSAEEISESSTYASSTISEDMVVTNGATLVIDQEVSVSQGVTITINDGSRLELVNGGLTGQDVNSHLQLYTDSSVSLDTSALSGMGTLRVIFVSAVNETISVNATVQNVTETNVTGDYVDFSVNLSESSIDVDITHIAPFYLTVDKFQILTENSESIYFQPHEVIINFGAFQQWMESSFTINNNGMFWVADSSIFGAQINCNGVCQMVSTSLAGSAPLEVSTDGDLTISDSSIIGSRTDEDIIVRDQGVITYNNNQGTGGMVDNWIRLVSERIVKTNIAGAEIKASGLGYYPASNQKVLISSDNGDYTGASFSDNTGDWVRIVEWQDGDGVYSSEEATIEVKVSSGWGEFTTQISTTPNSVMWANVSLPVIVVDAITPSKSVAEVNKPLGVNLSISNVGDAEAINPVFECYVGNDSADIGGYIQSSFYGTMKPGESLEIPFTWRFQYPEDAQISCSVLTPSGLENYVDLITTESPTSSVVSFSSPEEEGSTPWIAFLIAGGALVIGLALVARSQKIDEKEYAQEIAESESTILEEEVDDSAEEDNDSVETEGDLE